MTSSVENALQIEKRGNSDETSSPIQDFFSNSNVFLTGGTGFVGMLLLQKLLTSCPNISKIYMLVRNKKGKNVETRLNELFDDVVFSRMREQLPNFREKIVPVEGDCEFADLGLGSQDKTMLIDEVNIVFHVAATVRFDESLKKASFINVRAVRDILSLARQMDNLKSFVHVSTAFSNCIHNYIREEVYPPSMDYRKLLNVTEGLPDDLLLSITPLLLGRYPNTYTFTKQIGEDVVLQEGKDLPVGIYRPSIVTSTYKEPLRGWINNFYGPTGYAAGCGAGLIRIAECDPSKESNCVPADFVVNSIIATAWDVGEQFCKRADVTDDVPVYNFEAGVAPRLTWDDFAILCTGCAFKYCSVKAIWHVFGIITRFRLVYLVNAFFLHTVPAFFMDLVRRCLGKPPIMLKVYRKIGTMLEVSRYFLLREWNFESANMRRLKRKMSVEDRRTFYCDMTDFNWKDYLEVYTLGIRVYLIKDPLETLPQAQRRYRWLYWIHQFIKAVVGIVSLWMLKGIYSLGFVFTTQ